MRSLRLKINYYEDRCNLLTVNVAKTCLQMELW